MKYFLWMIFLVALVSCDPSRNEMGAIEGFAPVYASAQESTLISVETTKPTTNPGKIYAYNQYLFQVEQGEGIHIIDNSNPQQAHKIAFLNIPLCSELAIKSNFLYTNNINDLVVFDISNIASPQLVSRQENAFESNNQEYPPASNVYFECPDPSKGIVVGWERRIINNPKCRR